MRFSMKTWMRCLALGAVLSAAPAAYLHAQEPAAQETKPEADDTGWKWINFVILAAGLGYLIAKTMPAFFRARSNEIQKGIAEAQALKADAEKRAAQMEARLAALAGEIEKFRAEARSEMEQEGKRIAADTARQLQRVQQQVELEMETAAKTARRALQTYAAKLALDLAEQRIRARMDPLTEAGLIEDFVQDLEASRN